jgi:hypothetical protein
LQVAGRLQKRCDAVSRILLLSAVLTGCFYFDPINQRPSIDIRQTSSAEVYRGDTVELEAEAHDPDGHPVFFRWRAYACTDAAAAPDGSRPGCDEHLPPFYTEFLPKARFQVPSKRGDGTPVRAVLVYLEGIDDLGAIAKPEQQLIIPIANHAPELILRKSSPYDDVVNTPTLFYAKLGDPDDDLDKLTLSWRVYSPMTQPTHAIEDVTVHVDESEPQYLQFGKRLTPHGEGEWELEVTATDPVGGTTVKTLAFTVGPDKPPCLGQWAPIAPPLDSVLPVSEPTLFQVTVVQDDLDLYPPIAGDPVRGTTRFAWSIVPPGGMRQVLAGATANHVAFDPALYALGDEVELRVEIHDRVTRQLCDASEPTCAIGLNPSCLQRLTWRVEVR